MPEATVTTEDIYEALKTVYDPEIPVNIVDLGLVYDVQIKESDVYVQMTVGQGTGVIGFEAELLAIGSCPEIPTPTAPPIPTATATCPPVRESQQAVGSTWVHSGGELELADLRTTIVVDDPCQSVLAAVSLRAATNKVIPVPETIRVITDSGQEARSNSLARS